MGPEIDQDDCPDCPKAYDGKQTYLPPPDLPGDEVGSEPITNLLRRTCSRADNFRKCSKLSSRECRR